MDIYVCSTVRHLLFSLCRSQQNSSLESTIYFFYDYQNINLSNLSFDNLPEEIKVIPVKRSKVTASIKKSIFSRICYFLAMRSISPINIIRRKTIELLNTIGFELSHTKEVNLFVFNDRNKMSRIFISLFGIYHMIEDGVGNYKKIPVLFPKNVVRFILRKTPNSLIWGENKKCKSIHVLNPEKLQHEVQWKGLSIDFLDNYKGINLVNSVFKYSDQLGKNESIIIATQPMIKPVKEALHNSDFYKVIYQSIVNHCRKQNKPVYFKLHPSESEEAYATKFKDTPFLPTKMPLEVIALNATVKPLVVSINSAAGQGFERYCSTIQISNFGKISDMLPFLKQLEVNQANLDVKIAQILEENVR